MIPPVRIQRRRTKGWRMPPNTASVTRPHGHGNPFRVGSWCRLGDPGGGRFRMAYAISCIGEQLGFTLIETASQSVEWYRRYRAAYPLSEKDRQELRGKNLACFCPLYQPCHADVLLELANGDPTP